MSKIGLCLSFHHTNYGTLLQAYATQQAVEEMGYETEILDYYPGNDPHPRYNAAHFIQRGLGLLIPLRKKEAGRKEEQTENGKLRKLAAERFCADHLHAVVRCEGYHALTEYSKRFSAILAGSDQIWNPNTAGSNFFTLRFVPPGIKTISYASSMGVSEYPFYLREELRDFISGIDHLSVRETSAARIIADITGRKAEVVCDPTCLLTGADWARRFPAPPPADPYILCYFLGDCAQGRIFAEKLAAETSLPVVTIMNGSFDDGHCGRLICGASVPEFLDLIRGAAYVVTDSFHGIMFSLIHEKQFFAFYRVRKNTPYQRNARIDDILRTVHLEDRLITGTGLPRDPIDYSAVSPLLDDYRRHSAGFLRNALSQ